MDAEKLKIGVFDSGIGGFSILRDIHQQMPDAEIFYVADDAFAPYGDKTSEVVLSRAQFITEFLLSKGVSLIVIACNTATAVAIDALRAQYQSLKFVGVEPFLNAVNKTEIYDNIDKSKVGVIATPLTTQSKRFISLKSRFDPENHIAVYAPPNLAHLIECKFDRRHREGLDQEIKNELSPLKKLDLDYLILGCTHYPLISDLIESELDLKTISPGEFVAHQVSHLASYHRDFKRPPVTSFHFYNSSQIEVAEDREFP